MGAHHPGTRRENYFASLRYWRRLRLGITVCCDTRYSYVPSLRIYVPPLYDTIPVSGRTYYLMTPLTRRRLSLLLLLSWTMVIHAAPRLHALHCRGNQLRKSPERVLFYCVLYEYDTVFTYHIMLKTASSGLIQRVCFHVKLIFPPIQYISTSSVRADVF